MICARRERVADARPLDAFRALGFAVEGLAADVAKPADVQAVVDTAMRAYGQIDILVNNAGMTWGDAARRRCRSTSGRR